VSSDSFPRADLRLSNRMASADRLKSIRSFDLFLQTAHVESVALLVADS
jgi:hypothetical protein